MDAVNAGVKRFSERSQRYCLDNSIHYRFINELRYVEIALPREQFIFADMPQFKEYSTLFQSYLNRLKESFPQNRTCESIHNAKENLLALYLETVKDNGYLTFDDDLLKLLGCFE